MTRFFCSKVGVWIICKCVLNLSDYRSYRGTPFVIHTRSRTLKNETWFASETEVFTNVGPTFVWMVCSLSGRRDQVAPEVSSASSMLPGWCAPFANLTDCHFKSLRKGNASSSCYLKRNQTIWADNYQTTRLIPKLGRVSVFSTKARIQVWLFFCTSFPWNIISDFRYGTQINYQAVNPSQVRHLLISSDTQLPSVNEVPVPRTKRYISRRKSGKSSVCQSHSFASTVLVASAQLWPSSAVWFFFQIGGIVIRLFLEWVHGFNIVWFAKTLHLVRAFSYSSIMLMFRLFSDNSARICLIFDNS